jgi:hypothetical protein
MTFTCLLHATVTIESQKQQREKASDKAKANPFDKITLIDKCQLDALAAFMVYNYSLLLGFFDYPAVKAFLYRLRCDKPCGLA